MNVKSILWTALIAVVAVAIVNNVGMTRGVVTPAAPRF